MIGAAHCHRHNVVLLCWIIVNSSFIQSCRTAPSYPTGLPEPKPTYRNSAERKLHEKEKEADSQETKEHVSRLREAQVDALLARSDIKPIVEAYDRELGREAFRTELVRRAQLAWDLRKEDVTPQLALVELMATDPVADRLARQNQKNFRLRTGMKAEEVRELFGSPKQVEAVRGLIKNIKTGEKKFATFSQWTYDGRPCKLNSGNRSYQTCKLMFDDELILFEQVSVDPAYLDLNSKWQSSDPTDPTAPRN